MPTGPSTAVARADGYHFDTFLSSPFEFVVMSRAVNMATIPNPLQTLTFDNPYSGGGAFGDVQEGMEIIVYAGNTTTERGRLRVAAGGATSTVIQVNEVSDTRIPIADNDKFDVLLSFRLRDRLIGATETFPKDSRITYSAQNKDVAPLANDGGHYAAVWRGSNIAVTFYGNLTLPVDFDSNGPFTHAWTVYGPDSLTVAFTSSAENPTFTFTAAGTYWVRHIATDTDVSASWTKWSVVILDSSPIPVVLDTIPSSVSSPTSIQFQTHGSAGVDRLPNGAMILIHEDESIGSFGNRVTDRSRIKFTGYITRHTVHLEPLTGEVRFEAQSPLGILNALPGFSQALRQLTSDLPTTWQEYELGLTTNALLVYLLRWHTTYADLFDVVLPGYNYSYADAFVQQQTPAAQMTEIADAVDAFSRGDASGALMLRQDLNKTGTTWRDAAAVLYAFEETDFIGEVDLELAHRSDLAQLIYRMFSGDAGVESIAGEAPDEGSEFTSEERKIGAGQQGTDFSANERCGWAFAFKKKTYFGVPVWRLSGTLPGSYDWISTAYDQWVKVTLSRTVNGRTVTLTNYRMWVESAETHYEAIEDEFGTVQYDKTVSVVFVGETDGRKGKTQLPLTEEQNGLDDFDDPSIEFPNPDFDPALQFSGLSRGNPNIGVLLTTLLAYTNTFTTPEASGGPTWIQQSLPLDGGETIHDGVQSPFESTVLNCATTTKLRVYENVTTTPAVRYSNAFTYAVQASTYRSIQHEREAGNAGWIPVLYYASGRGLVYQGSINGGSTLQTAVDIGDTLNYSVATGTFAKTYPPLYVDPHTAGVAYTIARDGGSLYKLFKTTNFGASWSVSTDYPIGKDDGGGGASWSAGYFIVRPYQTTDFILFGQRNETAGAIPILPMKGIAATGDVQAPIYHTPTIFDEWLFLPGVGGYANQAGRHMFQPCDTNINKYLLLTPVSDGSSSHGIGKVLDGNTIIDVVPVADYPTTNWWMGGVIGRDGKAVYLWGKTHTGGTNGVPVGYVNDIDSWSSVDQLDMRKGTGFPDSGEALNLFGF